MDTDVSGDDLAGQAIRNTMWATVAYFSAKAASFAATAVLARILAPDQFGMVAIVLFSIQYLEVVNDAGMGAALITRSPSATRAPDTAFTLELRRLDRVVRRRRRHHACDRCVLRRACGYRPPARPGAGPHPAGTRRRAPGPGAARPRLRSPREYVARALIKGLVSIVLKYADSGPGP